MAGSTLEEGAQRHQKVYSFLKRVLPQDRYEGIRVIEPCVVVADGFKKTFQFAVLGDEMLYITENPPRSSKDIRLRVDLACVTSVELVSPTKTTVWQTVIIVKDRLCKVHVTGIFLPLIFWRCRQCKAHLLHQDLINMNFFRRSPVYLTRYR